MWALLFSLYTDAIIPECKNALVPVINEQLLDAMGYQLGFRYNEVEALQRAEIEKAESASFMASGVMGPAYRDNAVSLKEYRALLNALLQMSSLPPLDATFTPEERTPLDLTPAAGPDDDAGTPPGGGDAPGQSPAPKALPPEWGRLQVSLPNLAGGETKQQSVGDRATLTVT